MIDKNILYKFFEGKISPEEEEILFEWLRSSDEHEKEFLNSRKSYDLQLMSNSDKDCPININSEYNQFRKQLFRNSNKRHFIRSIRQVCKYAAILLIGLCIWDVIQNRVEIPTGPFTHKEIAEEIISIQIPRGKKQSLTLPDGTQVWLNSETELKYPRTFSSHLREVWLDGEAYFEVAHNSSQKFVVHAGEFDIRVYGTSFNVLNYKNEIKKCTLIEGSVSLENTTGNDQKETPLSPGHQAIYTQDRLQIISVNTSQEIGWKEGKFYFNSEPFSEICRKLERSFDVNIHIQNESLKKSVFTGRFTNGESLDEILSIISWNKKIHYEKQKNNIFIYKQ